MARSCCCSHTQFSVSSSRLFLLSFTASAPFPPAHAHLRYRKSQLVCSSSATPSAAAAKSRVVVDPPPEDYDFRAETRLQTVETVRTHFPQLMDLVEDGTLVVVKRAVDYVERRSDGYVEPEVVFVVGTAHMSRVSALQVTRVVNAVQPENVVVELCRSRAGIMYDVVVPAAAPITESNVANLMQGQQQQQQNPNLMSMSGDNFGSAVSRSLELGGRSALALRLLLGAMSKRISSSAGVATGEEFRAARKAAEEIGAQIVLGDRPIEITLQRAWDALRWDESLRLAMTFIQAMTASNLDASEETLEILFWSRL
ncbi:hypothetical protein BDL97_03G100400 [Sphagnum fallax]|nr:hypothetical protein BDL97_03G100400 [Sphagnum fallax]